MKIKKILLILILSILWHRVLFAQNIVKDTSKVKRPIVGKLYYQKTDNNLYLFRKGFELVDLYQESILLPPDTSIVQPPIILEKEYIVGFWDLPNRILVSKLINGKYYLMQRDNLLSYYVARGKNILNDNRSKISANEAILKNIVSENSGIGGLDKPNNFPETDFLAMGYYRNENGEYISNKTITPVIPTTSDKIKIPVGAIMWDGWYRDYWNDENPLYDKLINHVSKSRLIATEYMDKFNVLPFYGQYHKPEKIKIRYNVKWNQELGRNTYDEMDREVQLKYDKTQADCDREIQYYSEAGFDFFCFNYYDSDSPLSEARLQFVNSNNKRGIKMTFMLASKRSDREINYITDLMLKDFWFKIDNKPVLYFNNKDMLDMPKYKAAYSAKGGGDIYVVYYSMGGYPGEFAEYQKYRANAGSSYTLFIGQGTADMLIKAEVEARNTWMGQYKNTQINLIPVLTTGFENLHHRSSLDIEPAQFVEKATLPQIEKKLELMKIFIKEHPEKVPAILWYAGNEILESGNPIVPTKRIDGSIDTSILETISKHLN